VHLSSRKIDARAGADRRVCLAGPHPSLATQNEKHFLVLVKMIGRAARWNRADELRYLFTPDLIVN
jgi:hypothetical protein